MTARYGMERSSPKRRDYSDDERVPGPNAVKAATPAPFVEYRVPQAMRDTLSKLRQDFAPMSVSSRVTDTWRK